MVGTNLVPEVEIGMRLAQSTPIQWTSLKSYIAVLILNLAF